MNSYLDGRREYARPLSRFLLFGLVAIVGLSILTARLFYLQVMSGGTFATLAEGNRTVLQAIPSSRGLIYDRTGQVLVTNVPTFAVKIRPADLPEERRDEVVARLAALIGTPIPEINSAIDGNPGSRFDPVRIAQDVPKETANLIAEAGYDLPGVEIVVEARREYADGPLLSQLLGYTGPVSSEQLEELKSVGYLPDDLIGKTGLESYYEEELRGVYGAETVERDAAGRKLQVLDTVSEAQAGNSLRLTIDAHEQELAQQALLWGMKEAGLKRGVVIVMNPQTGEILAMVSLPTYDNNAFARGISAKDYAALLANPDKPLLNHAVSAHYPPGSTYKLVAGTGALADSKITPSTRIQTRPYLTLGTTKFWEWNHRGWGGCNLDCGFGHSSDTYFFQLAGMLGIDRLGYWAQPVRVRRTDRHRPARRGGRDRPDERVEAPGARRADLPGRGLPGGDRPGLRRRDAAPADQRVRRARQRRQALRAAGSSATSSDRTARSSAVRAEAHPRARRVRRAS